MHPRQNNQTPINNEAVSHGIHATSGTLEQRQAGRAEAPLKPKDIWAIRIQLQNAHLIRDLVMFNLVIDSKLRGCDLGNLRVRDIGLRGHARIHKIPYLL